MIASERPEHAGEEGAERSRSALTVTVLPLQPIAFNGFNISCLSVKVLWFPPAVQRQTRQRKCLLG